MTSRPGAKKLAWVVAGVLAVGLVVLFAREYGRARDVEACATELADAVRKHDRGTLEVLVPSSQLRDKLAAVGAVQIGYVRPMSGQAARVGLFVKSTETATAAGVIAMVLELEALPQCRFVRDYESGPFGGQGR